MRYKGSGWLRGSGLVTKFRDSEIGRTVVTLEFKQVDDVLHAEARESGQGSLFDCADQLSASEFGVAVRKDFDMRHC